jgi:hypothetical protein
MCHDASACHDTYIIMRHAASTSLYIPDQRDDKGDPRTGLSLYACRPHGVLEVASGPQAGSASRGGLPLVPGRANPVMTRLRTRPSGRPGRSHYQLQQNAHPWSSTDSIGKPLSIVQCDQVARWKRSNAACRAMTVRIQGSFRGGYRLSEGACRHDRGISVFSRAGGVCHPSAACWLHTPPGMCQL